MFEVVEREVAKAEVEKIVVFTCDMCGERQEAPLNDVGGAAWTGGPMTGWIRPFYDHPTMSTFLCPTCAEKVREFIEGDFVSKIDDLERRLAEQVEKNHNYLSLIEGMQDKTESLKKIVKNIERDNEKLEKERDELSEKPPYNIQRLIDENYNLVRQAQVTNAAFNKRMEINDKQQRKILKLEKERDELKKRLEDAKAVNRITATEDRTQGSQIIHQSTLDKLIEARPLLGKPRNPKPTTYAEACADLKPFDKVLVRDLDCEEWRCSFFSHMEGWYYHTTERNYMYCLPYEQNKHLLGTTDIPWEE